MVASGNTIVSITCCWRWLRLSCFNISLRRQHYSSLSCKIGDLALRVRSTEDRLEELQRDVSRSLDLLTPMASSLARQIGETGSKAESERLNELTVKHTAALNRAVAALENMSRELRTVKRNKTILKSLSFSALKCRQDAIPSAHRETLRWIYDSRRTAFEAWLQEGKGIFWVSGLVSPSTHAFHHRLSTDGT